MSRRNTVVIGMILIAAVSRLIPHPPNFTAVGVLALFGGVQLRNRCLAFLVPLGAMFLSDLVLGLHQLIPWVYGSFALSACLGYWVRQDRRLSRVAWATLSGSMLFYLITNFGVWLKLGTYPQNASGLIECYLAGLPYLVNTVLGDFFYASVLFGGLAFAEYRFVWLRPSTAQPCNVGAL